MTLRNTGTGAVLEEMVLPALRRGGYDVQKQVTVGQRPGGGSHKVDAVASKGGAEILISLKWQQTSGTAEQKVPFEVICLSDAVRRQKGSKAYLVLGGDGWTLRDFYTSGGLHEHLKDTSLVEILPFETFVRLANNGEL